MESWIIDFFNSQIFGCILLVLFIVGFFWLLIWIGSKKRKEGIYVKIKNMPEEMKSLFNEEIDLPRDILFFSYGSKDRRLSIITHIFVALLLISLVCPTIGVLLSERVNETVIIILNFLAAIAIIYWRIILTLNLKRKLKEKKYRFGIFLLKDQLIIRDIDWPTCIVFPKKLIKEVRDCRLWTSDTSEDEGITVIYLREGKYLNEEVNVSGEFFGTSNEKVIQAINGWLHDHKN